METASFTEGCRVVHVHRGLLPSTGLNFTPISLSIYLAGPWKRFCRAWSVNCCTRPGSCSPLCQDQRRHLVTASAWCLVEQEWISQTWGFRLSWRCWWPKASVHEGDCLEIVPWRIFQMHSWEVVSVWSYMQIGALSLLS